MPYMEEFLKGKHLEFTITVVEQAAGKPFNKAKLLNTGFVLTRDLFDYFCLHDIDMLPETDAADYGWAHAPTHLAACVSQYGYRLPYLTYFGGVTMFSREDFQRVNGCSNEYWGWGLEDHDLFVRCRLSGLEPYRRLGRYVSLWHEPNGVMVGSRDVSEETIENRRRLHRFVSGELDHRCDGLSSLRYRIVDRKTIFDRHHMITVEI